MSEKVTITVKLFGAFRQYCEAESVSVDIEKGSGVALLREALKNALNRGNSAALSDLINHSALANGDSILGDALSFDDNAEVALLPPVCGG